MLNFLDKNKYIVGGVMVSAALSACGGGVFMASMMFAMAVGAQLLSDEN